MLERNEYGPTEEFTTQLEKIHKLLQYLQIFRGLQLKSHQLQHYNLNKADVTSY